MKDIKIQRYKDIKGYISGFTLIELLVTISIIAILLGFVSARYITIEKQGRDVRRKSDLSQYRIALENYAVANNSLYPTPAGGAVCVEATSLCGAGTTFLNFMPTCPTDPRYQDNTSAKPSFYQYCSSGSTVYVLNSMMETTAKIWQICSTGISCLTTRTTYPSGAVCAAICL